MTKPVCCEYQYFAINVYYVLLAEFGLSLKQLLPGYNSREVLVEVIYDSGMSFLGRVIDNPIDLKYPFR